ncbi:hypothetical protein ACFLZW_05545 [Chloroflexota bacterium]
MNIKKLSLVLLVILIATLACQIGASEPTPTPTPDFGPGQTATADALNRQTTTVARTAEAVETNNSQSTLDAQATDDAQAAQDSQATADAIAEATVAQETQAAFEFEATRTQRIFDQQTATAEIKLQQTAQAEVIVERINNLVNEGVVPNAQGQYERLDNFDESWAQMNWFQWWSTGKMLENFVIRTDVEWSSASDTANWFNTGCGFVFGLEDNNNFHVVQLRLDNFVTLKYWRNGNGNWIAQRPSGQLSTPDGEAEIMLVVYEKRVTFYIDGKDVLSEYASLLKEGMLAMTLSSGTNKGYGTRCKMTDVDLWIIK